MKVSELMTKKLACATPDMDLSKVARLMEDHNVGAIPVVEDKNSKKLVGVVTDRDIATRAVARGKNPLQMTAMEVMSTPVFTVRVDDDVEEVTQLMEKRQVRRVPVVNEHGDVCGMVSQADIALKTTDRTTGNLVEAVSKPSKK